MILEATTYIIVCDSCGHYFQYRPSMDIARTHFSSPESANAAFEKQESWVKEKDDFYNCTTHICPGCQLKAKSINKTINTIAE